MIFQVAQYFSNVERIAQWLSRTWFSLSQRREYFSIILSAVQNEFFCLDEMHKLSRQDADLHVLSFVFLSFQGSPPEITLRFASDLEVIRTHPKLLHARSYGLGSIVPEFHDKRMVCLLKAFTPAWVTNTILVSPMLVIDVRNRLCSLLRFVRGITSQSKTCFIGRARASAPTTCLKQTLLCAPWAEQ